MAFQVTDEIEFKIRLALGNDIGWRDVEDCGLCDSIFAAENDDECYQEIKTLPTRKDQALAIKDFPYNGIVFKMLDKKDYAESIWKMLKPKFEVPFKTEI